MRLAFQITWACEEFKTLYEKRGQMRSSCIDHIVNVYTTLLKAMAILKALY